MDDSDDMDEGIEDQVIRILTTLQSIRAILMFWTVVSVVGIAIGVILSVVAIARS
jgi:hypothetical protein